MEEENELEVVRTQLADYITGLGWSADNEYLCVSDASGKLTIIHQDEEVVKKEIQAHQGSILGLSVSGNLAASVGEDGQLVLTQLREGTEIFKISLGKTWAEWVSWSPDGKYVAASCGKKLFIYDSFGKCLAENDRHESTISGLHWRFDSRSVASTCYGSMNITSAVHADLRKKFLWKNSMVSMLWSPDGKFICAGTQDCKIHIWPEPFKPGSDFEMSGYPQKVRALSFDVKAKFMATGCHNELILWKFAGKAPIGQQPLQLKGHASRIQTLAFQRKGPALASGDQMGFLLFWLPEKSQEFVTGARFKGEITSMSWSTDDMYLAIGTSEGEVVILESPE